MTKDDLQKELDRIKEGIKRNQITMIVDGNDMIDWGWMTIKDHNRQIKELKNSERENHD